MDLRRQLSFRLRPSGRTRIVYLIQLHVTYAGHRLKISTGCQVDRMDAWDMGTETVRADYVGTNGETALTINGVLRRYKDMMEWAFKYFEVNDTIPSMEQISSKFKEKIPTTHPSNGKEVEKKMEPSFFDRFDQFTKECGEKNAWTPATYEKMATLRQDLATFMPTLSFDGLSESTLTQFVVFLRDDKVLRTPRVKKDQREDDNEDAVKGLNNSTIGKKLEYLRWFMNWATRMGYNSNTAYASFKPTLKTAQNKVIYLTKEEIARIRELDLSSGRYIYLDPVRDIFLFCCFSGLRYSDAYNLKKGDLKETYCVSVNIKTGKTVYVDYNKTSKAILDKYKDVQFNDNKALPPYTNQALNRDVKELCRIAGVNEEIEIVTYKGAVRKSERHPKWELVGTHTGRHTFIVQALSLGIPPNVIMKWTGHSDYKSMKPYVDIVDSIKASSMTKFDTLV